MAKCTKPFCDNHTSAVWCGLHTELDKVEKENDALRTELKQAKADLHMRDVQFSQVDEYARRLSDEYDKLKIERDEFELALRRVHDGDCQCFGDDRKCHEVWRDNPSDWCANGIIEKALYYKGKKHGGL